MQTSCLAVGVLQIDYAQRSSVYTVHSPDPFLWAYSSPSYAGYEAWQLIRYTDG